MKLNELIQKMIFVEPKQRLSAAEVLVDVWRLFQIYLENQTSQVQESMLLKTSRSTKKNIQTPRHQLTAKTVA